MYVTIIETLALVGGWCIGWKVGSMAFAAWDRHKRRRNELVVDEWLSRVRRGR